MMRLLTAAGLSALVIVLCVYCGRHHPGISIEECLSSPGTHDGLIVYSPHESDIGALTGDGFILRWHAGAIPVKGKAPHLRVGEYVGVKGVFRKEGYVDAVVIHVGRYRRLKMAASAAAAVAVFYLLHREFTWIRRRRALVSR
ncbi:MAG: hypothetical protein NT045_02105 [Candidatus Aureabacteria bacterium]|nr:hypothetical protein [Candidatus Auribacterota bacterium]